MIIDDHEFIRLGIAAFLEPFPAITVVGVEATGQKGIASAYSLAPDIVLCDIMLPDMTGFDVIETIAEQKNCLNKYSKVIAVTGSIHPTQIQSAFSVGARGIILKTEISENLAAAISAVYDGNYYLSGKKFITLSGISKFFESTATAKQIFLTSREREVLQQIVKGKSNQDIAASLNITEQTIKRHISNIFNKVGVTSRLELAVYALQNELI